MKNVKKPTVARRKVLIVDDHPLLREGLSKAINQQPDLVVCGEAGTAPGGLAAVAKYRPDLVIVDISLEDGSGLELIKDLHVQFAQLPVLALSMHDETLYAERALRAGARGYLMKREPVTAVIAALRKLAAGQLAVSEVIANRLLGAYVRTNRAAVRTPADLLSDRELQVFELLGQGRSTRVIAQQLHLGMKTVATHRRNMMLKLKIKDAGELLHLAIRRAADQPSA